MKQARTAFIILVFAMGAGDLAFAQNAPAPQGTAASTIGSAYWGKPSVDGGKCCVNLGEVRTNIDRLDREIIRMMAERGKYVAEAGRFKKDPAAVSDPARVEQIIIKVKGIAKEAGLAESVAEKAYRAMIAGFEDFERESWGKEKHEPTKN